MPAQLRKLALSSIPCLWPAPAPSIVYLSYRTPPELWFQDQISQKPARNPDTLGLFSYMDHRDQVEQTLRRQLTAFAQFTTRSLGESNIDSLMLDACLRSRAGLNVSHAKLMEYLPDRDRLLLRAGVGWKEGYVGQADQQSGTGPRPASVVHVFSDEGGRGGSLPGSMRDAALSTAPGCRLDGKVQRIHCRRLRRIPDARCQ
jgi:hypothetical protein